MASETTGEQREQQRVPMLQFPGFHAIVAGIIQAAMGYWMPLYGWTPMVRYVRTELKFTTTDVGLGASAGRIMGVIGSPAGGWAVDHWGPRWGTIVFLSIMSLGVCAYAFINDVWTYALIYGVIVYFVYYGGLYRMSWTAANRWWMDYRSMAIAAVTLGGGSSGIWGGPLTVWMCDTFGWRTAAVQSGIATLILCVGAAFLYPDRMPEHYGMHVDNLSPEQRRARAEAAAARRGQRAVMRPFLADLTVGQALRSWAFWMLTLGGLFAAFAGAPVTLFQNMRMGAAGYTEMQAAFYFTLRIVFSYVGRVGVLFFGDWASAKWPPRYIYALGLFAECIGITFFALGVEAIYFITWAVVEGAGYGLQIPFLGVVLGAYFGRAAFGLIYGLRTGLAALGGAVAPTLVGWITDASGGDWTLAFYVVVVGYFLAGVCMCLAFPPKEQVRERRGAA